MKKYILPLVVLVISGHLFAGTVSVPDAQNVALNFFKVTNPAAATAGALTATLKMTYTESDNTVDFYVFDISPLPGFVIVAGSDNVIPILGYSTEGNFKTNYQKTSVSHWTYKVGSTIHQVVLANTMADAHIQGLWSAYRSGQNPSPQRSGSVSPMCSTTWDQENDVSNPPPFYYNGFCPYNTTDQQRALTGCVATAMAQIMKYWNYPAQGTGSYTYQDEISQGYSNNYGTQSSDFAAHTYQWSLMPNACIGSETGAQDTAVDMLMYDCAVSVGMDFGDDNQDGSGANGLLAEEIAGVGDSICSQTAFAWYFGYERDTMKGIFDSSYNAAQWIALLENDLNVGRPILYEGDDSTQGGHAWVCDGYDVNNKFHMNWGWGGADDGYFAFTNLSTPGSPPFNPVVGEDALIGIVPRYIAEGINKISNNFAFSVYPNPANNQVILQTGETNNGAIWSVKNLLGQTVATGSVVSARTTVNISGLSNGVYLVEMQQGEQTAVKKIVVSH